MKINISEEIEIPEGVSCNFTGKSFTCTKGSVSLKRQIDLPTVSLEVKDRKIILSAKKGSKKELKYIKSCLAHLRNLFSGLDNKYIYRLESCNVHFPMTLKLDANTLVINNFLGERVSRKAKIMPGVDVDIKGSKITLSSHDKEAAGETATNIEKATKIKNRDRRVFQDGIFIVEKPSGGFA